MTTEHPTTGDTRTLYQWFAESAQRWPEAVAVQVRGEEVSYATLRDAAAVIADRITGAHGSVPARVGLVAARSVVAFAGYLAVQRLGAAVIPLNPAFPVSRNKTVCELSGAEVVLTDESGVPQADGLGAAASTVLTLADAEVLGTEPTDAEYRDSTPDDIAYLLFTSGSTGRPKGVPIRHRNASPYIAHNIARFQVGPGCRVSHTFDLTFDPSVFDLFVTWGGGATLVAPQRAELLTPVDYLVDNGITHWFSVPSVVSVSADLGNLPTGLVTSLRHSVFIGEQLTDRQARAWRAVAPDAVIDNVYGPTELTVACTEYRLPADPADWPVTSNDTVPIGPVYDFLDYVIVDEEGRRADEGELCVRGSQRFDGYLDPEDDTGRFLTTVDGRFTEPAGPLHPDCYYRTGDRVRFESGHLVHLGRLDNQVKIRGYRIELGEIETVLRRHEDVSHAVVVALRQDDSVELAGCYTGRELGRNDLIRWLRRQLPIHMLPRRMRFLDALPLNDNGKVDRGRVTELLAEGTPLTAARSEKG